MKQIARFLFSMSLVFGPLANADDDSKQHQLLQPTEMSCVIGVFRAQDIGRGGQDVTSQIVRIKIKDGEGDQEFKLNGETVAVILNKKNYTQVYQIQFLLLTPEADRPPRGPRYVTSLGDYLVYEGPARNSGFAPDVRAGSQAYEYLINSNGSVRLTPKVRVAMEKAGFWGMGMDQFSTTLLDMYKAHRFYDDVLPKLLEQKLLVPSDVIGMYSVFTCTGNH